MRGCWRSRSGLAAESSGGKLAARGMVPELGRSGIYPRLFLKSVQIVYLHRTTRSPVLESAQVASIVEVVGMRKSNESALKWALYYLSGIIPQL